MSQTKTALSYPQPSNDALGSSIAPVVNADDKTYVQVVESNQDDVRGLLARTKQFPPLQGSRIRNDPGGDILEISDPRIEQRTLRSGAESSITQLGEVNPGLGPDVAFSIKQAQSKCGCSKHKRSTVVSREIAGVGAVLTHEKTDGKPLNNQARMVGRVWKYFPGEETPNQYIQYDLDGMKLFAPPSTYERQGFQWTSLANGNFGIMDDDPQHRLSLGPSPCDEGHAYGAYIGNYIILDDGQDGVKLTAKNGHLYVNGAKVLTESC